MANVCSQTEKAVVSIEIAINRLWRKYQIVLSINEFQFEKWTLRLGVFLECAVVHFFGVNFTEICSELRFIDNKMTRTYQQKRQINE